MPLETITSVENPRIKEAVRLRTSRSARYEKGLFLLESAKVAAEALRAGLVLRRVFLTEEALERQPELTGRLIEAAQQSCVVSAAVAQKLSETKTPQGIFCVCELPEKQITPQQLSAGGSYMLLCSLQDPGNIGTIVRTAHAFGITGVILSADCPDLFGPKVLRATMGSVFAKNVYVCADPGALVDALRALGQPVYAAALTENSKTLGEVSLAGPCTVLIGNEGNGLTQEMIDRCTAALRIPMRGNAQSLNAAIAASVLLWEMVRDERE